MGGIVGDIDSDSEDGISITFNTPVDSVLKKDGNVTSSFSLFPYKSFGNVGNVVNVAKLPKVKNAINFKLPLE